MIKLKLLLTGAVSLLIIFTALPLYGAVAGIPSTASSSDTSIAAPNFKDGAGSKLTSGSISDVSHTICPGPEFVNWISFDTVTTCEVAPIYDTIVAISTDPSITITLTLVSGPGTFSSTPSFSPVKGYYSYTPPGPGSYVVTFKAVDANGTETIATKTYVVLANGSPVITTGDSSFYNCFAGQNFSYQINATDPEDDPLTFSLVTGAGEIDPVKGFLMFYADTSGEYCFQIKVSDLCGSVTAPICLTVSFNSLPQLHGYAKRIEICEPDTVCFEISASDPDSLDQLIITQIEGPGVFVMTDSATGRTCFLPANVDSADYKFIYGVTDDCLRNSLGKVPACPPLPVDSVMITVIIKPGAALTFPGDTSLSICQPDTICISAPGIPEGASVTVSPAPAWYDSTAKTVCFFAANSGDYNLKLVVSGKCGVDSCAFNVHVTMNSAPSAVLVPDTSMYLCQLDSVCLPVTVNDFDNNILEVTTSPNAHYDRLAGKLCLLPAVSGVYTVWIKAVDSCGAFAIDSANITVTLNGPPVVTAAPDFDVSQCNLAQICFPVTITDPENKIHSVEVFPNGAYDSQSGKVCFIPAHAGINSIIIRVSDSCGALASDTVNVNVILNSAPVVISAPDSAITLCQPALVCFPVSITDINRNISSITVGGGASYSNGSVCFTPSGAGMYQFIITATDSCGAVGIDTTNINVVIENPPSIVCPPQPIPVTMCGPGEVCVDLPIADISNVVVNGAHWADGKLCFSADTTGTYRFQVIASNQCGAADTCDLEVNVTINGLPEIACPSQPVKLSICGPQSVCTSLAIGNYDSVRVDGASWSNGQLCFDASASGIYTVKVKAFNACGIESCSVIFDISMSEPVTLACPRDTSLFICQPDTICIPVGGVPIGATVTVTPPSAWYDAAHGTVCFYTNCSVNKSLKIVVATACSKDSCQFVARVTMNTKPLVLMMPDTTVVMCQSGSICVPAAVWDANRNIVSIITSPEGAQYDQLTGKICFTPTLDGDYTVILKAIDDCGAFGIDSCNVHVRLNHSPTVTAAGDFSVAQCVPTQICFPVTVADIDRNLKSVSVVPYGSYDALNGRVCFTPTGSGDYSIVITATDSCGYVASDTTRIHVSLNSAPIVISAPDTTFWMCSLVPISLPVHVSDADGNLSTVTVSGGATYSNGFLNFNPPGAGTYTFILTATDSCGIIASDTSMVVIVLNRAPSVIAPADTSVQQCTPAQLCLQFAVTDQDHNIKSVTPSTGNYDPLTGRVCFTPGGSGTYSIVLTATDSCNISRSDTVTVTVTSGSSAEIACPPGPIAISLCNPGQVCQPLVITPAEAAVQVSYGTYSNGQLCFSADTTGQYKIRVIATAACGPDTCNIVFNVNIGQPPHITCPSDTSVFLCAPDSVNRAVSITPPEAQVTVLPAGIYHDGKVFFRADTSGTYLLKIKAQNQCGIDSCQFRVTVKINTVPVVTAGNDTTYFQCNLAQICRPVNITDPDNNIVSVTVLPQGTYNSDLKEVCFTPSATGTYCLRVTATDACGKSAVDTVCITVNSAPSAHIQCPGTPFDFHQCGPGQVCFPLVVTPSDAQVTVSNGTFLNNQICFHADTAGSYRIKAIASAPCGNDSCTITVNVAFDLAAQITCPDMPTSVSLCAPDSVRILLPITPSSATVRISPNASYSFSTHKLAFFADTSGTYKYNVIASTSCGADTCVVQATVTMEKVPQVTCPGNFDTTVCLSKITEICFPIGLDYAGATVTVLPSGHYGGGMGCIPVTAAGLYPVTVIASSMCGADTCKFNLTVHDNMAPLLTVPSDKQFSACEDNLQEICIDGIFATDPEGNSLTVAKTCGVGSFTAVRSDSGKLCFTPTRIDTTYQFCFEATDGCKTTSKSFFVTIVPAPDCGTCIELSLRTDSCVVVGATVPVQLYINTKETIGGFDLLISYDASVMSILSVLQGTPIGGWEYFTYRVGGASDCGSGCPTGLVRIVAIADINNGSAHPPAEQLLPQGVIARLMMKVVNDQNLGGQFLPIGFYWLDCGDNVFSDPTGTQLFVEARIFNSSNELIWDEGDNILYPESNRIDGLGAPDSCIVGDKTVPIRCIDFHNGGICVKHPDSIDARGDINLNGVAYEIGDAVVFTNYFIYGLRAFIVSPDGQTAASDVNADGMVLTVADLVYLVRVITGDAQGKPKLSPDLATVDFQSVAGGGSVNVSLNNDYPLGAALLVFKYDGVTPKIPVLSDRASDMNMKYIIDESEVRILLYSFESGVMIKPGSDNLIKVDYEGNGTFSLAQASAAGYYGETMSARLVSNALPDKFMISQNYPNPFNPTTSIDLSLPVSCKWRLSIYNVNGQVVKHLNGDANAGKMTVTWDGRNDNGQMVTSGIYFYKVEAGTFNVTRKMILLK